MSWVRNLGEIIRVLTSDDSTADEISKSVQKLKEEFLGQFKDSEYTQLYSDLEQMESILSRMEKKDSTRSELQKNVFTVFNKLNAVYTEIINRRDPIAILEDLEMAEQKIRDAATPEEVAQATALLESIIKDAEKEGIPVKEIKSVLEQFELGYTTRNELVDAIENFRNQLEEAEPEPEAPKCGETCNQKAEPKPPRAPKCGETCNRKAEPEPPRDPKCGVSHYIMVTVPVGCKVSIVVI